MRACWLWLGLAACADGDGADTDAVDTDGGGAHTDAPHTDVTDPTDDDPSDDTDSESDAETDLPGPIVYTPVRPVADWVESVVDGRAVSAWVPDNAEGLLFVFHGTGGSSEIADATEMVALLNEVVGRRIGFAALSSQNTGTGVFDDSTAPASNDDWKRVVAVRQLLIDEGLIDASTPIHGFGYSAGGGMASYLAHAGLAAGWPIGRLDFMHTGGRSNRYGSPPQVPVIATAAVNDTTVSESSVRAWTAQHAADGALTTLLVHEEQALTPTRFSRTPFISLARSRAYATAVLEAGLFTDQGLRTFPASAIDENIEAVVALPAVDLDKPVRAVLGVVLATHAINGEHAAAEANFLAGLP